MSATFWARAKLSLDDRISVAYFDGGAFSGKQAISISEYGTTQIWISAD
jgi:hypothetical protein